MRRCGSCAKAAVVRRNLELESREVRSVLVLRFTEEVQWVDFHASGEGS